MIDRLQAALPGNYSTYAQVQDSDAGGRVIDLNIRPLYGAGESVFLFESQTRGSGLADYDIYWLKWNSQSGQAELHFTRPTGSEQSGSLQDTLALARQRVLPGCVMELSTDGQQIYAQSDPDSCRFEDPYQGATRLYRSLTLGPDGLELETVALQPGEQPEPGKHKLMLQKLRVFEGQASVGTLDSATGEYRDWQSSLLFNIRDDGRTVQLYDSASEPMQFAMQLTRQHWRAGEPPYMKLTVINVPSDMIQAYSWFKDGPEPIDMKLEWFRVKLKLKVPETEAGNP